MNTLIETNPMRVERPRPLAGARAVANGHFYGMTTWGTAATSALSAVGAGVRGTVLRDALVTPAVQGSHGPPRESSR